MSDERAKWINELAGDYVEDWVGGQVAAVWEEEVVNLQERIKELEATIAELKQLADPLTKALYKEMSERHTAVCFKNKELREAARAVVEHKWFHRGKTCVYEDELDALAALLEKNYE